MAFNTVEASVDTGEVYYTITFSFSNQNYYYSSRPTDITIGAITYAPGLINFSGLTDDLAIRSIPTVDITLDRSITLFDVVVENSLTSSLAVQIHRRYVNETETRRIFNGFLSEFRIERPIFILTCKTLLSRLDNLLVGETISPMCRFTLYDNHCGVARNSYVTTLNSFSVTENIISVPAGVLNTTLDYYRHGLFICNNRYREVYASDSTSLTLSNLFEQGSATTALVYAGCDHQRTTCTTKFNNRQRFGGFPGRPSNRNLGGL